MNMCVTGSWLVGLRCSEGVCIVKVGGELHCQEQLTGGVSHIQGVFSLQHLWTPTD